MKQKQRNPKEQEDLKIRSTVCTQGAAIRQLKLTIHSIHSEKTHLQQSGETEHSCRRMHILMPHPHPPSFTNSNVDYMKEVGEIHFFFCQIFLSQQMRKCDNAKREHTMRSRQSHLGLSHYHRKGKMRKSLARHIISETICSKNQFCFHGPPSKDSLASQPCFLPSLLPSFFFLLRGRDRDRNRQNSHLLVHSPTFPQQLGVDLAQIGSWKINSGLPRQLSHDCCLPGSLLTGTWSQEPELGVKPVTLPGVLTA